MPGAAPTDPRGRDYVPSDPARSVLHRVVEGHLRSFLSEMDGREDGPRVPDFVRREFERFESCGDRRRGFARFRCDGCKAERLVAFTCKRRGFCPRCCGRRMVERSAHLVDRVFPFVPVRQWVLSVPFAMRHRLAWDHELCRAVLRVFARALQRHYRAVARKRGVERGRTGSVTVIQRAGAALNLNIHFHTLGLDGVFSEAPDGTLRFHRAEPPTDADVAKVLQDVVRRIRGLLERRGLVGPGAAEEDPPEEASLYAASAGGVVTTGTRAGRRPARLRSAATAAHGTKKGSHGARLDGFDLHAGAAVRARRRRPLEKLCRYVLRPPVAEARLEESGDRILLRLIRPWRDGSTHIVFEPHALLEKLAAIVPRPQKNTTLYHGVLSAHSAFRARVVDFGRPCAAPATPPETKKRPNPAWADLMRRGLEIDCLACPCGGRFRFVACITDPRVARRILERLHLLPVPATARAPPPAPPSAFRLRLDALSSRFLSDLASETRA